MRYSGSINNVVVVHDIVVQTLDLDIVEASFAEHLYRASFAPDGAHSFTYSFTMVALPKLGGTISIAMIETTTSSSISVKALIFHLMWFLQLSGDMALARTTNRRLRLYRFRRRDRIDQVL